MRADGPLGREPYEIAFSKWLEQNPFDGDRKFADVGNAPRSRGWYSDKKERTERGSLCLDESQVGNNTCAKRRDVNAIGLYVFQAG